MSNKISKSDAGGLSGIYNWFMDSRYFGGTVIPNSLKRNPDGSKPPNAPSTLDDFYNEMQTERVNRTQRNSTPTKDIIKANLDAANKTGLDRKLSFPNDMPPFNFNIFEMSWGTNTLRTATRNLDVERMYKLPLPTGMTDDFSISYNDNTSITQAVDSRVSNALDALSQKTAMFGGFVINQYKTVTLQQPNFREFGLTWTLSPKDGAESEMIRKIIAHLRRAMTPETKGSWLDSQLFFPRLFALEFVPNPGWLYKFKPCALTQISVSYTGGQNMPAFYQVSNSASDSPPEGVVISTKWLELEYWLRRNYDDEIKGANHSPFSVWHKTNGYTINPTRKNEGD